MTSADAARPELRFFFGAMSPYSWLAAERIDRVLPGAEWRPVFLGGLFKAAGRTSWGLTERRDAGRADCESRARAYGLGSMRWPDRWPTSDLVVARAMIAAAEQGLLRDYALAAMRLSFLEGGDLGELAVVQEAGSRVGLDRAEVARWVADDRVKRSLRAATDEAASVGVVGVPTVAVGERLFWGDDRLDQARAHYAEATGGG